MSITQGERLKNRARSAWTLALRALPIVCALLVSVAFIGISTAVAQEEIPPEGARRVRVFPRSDVPVQAQWFPNPNRPGEWIAIISSGVNLLVDGLDGFGSIDVATDRLVLWTQSQQAPVWRSLRTNR